jgi:hypothetical protein
MGLSGSLVLFILDGIMIRIVGIWIFSLISTWMSSYIYIIGSDNPPYKIGISKNPEHRLKNLQTGHPHRLKIWEVRETESKKTKLLESVIHKHLDQYRMSGEWFNIPLEQAILHVDFALIRYEDDPLLEHLVREKLIR